MRMRLLVIIASAAVLLTACGVRVSPAAVDETAKFLGKSTRSLELADDDLSRLAKQFGVTTDAISGVAPSVDTDSVWKKSIASMSAINKDTDGPVRSVVIGTACDYLTAPSQSDAQTQIAPAPSDAEIQRILLQQVGGLSKQNLQSLTEDVRETHRVLKDASRINDRGKAAVAVLCFSAKQL